MRKAYSIFSPPFDPRSGGIRVLYGLMGWLLAKGEIAFMNAKFDDPTQCIAIYPEIAHGNPIGATTIVRYILNKPGVMWSYGRPGPTEFDKSDKIYVFSRIYDTFNVDDDHLLFLPIINLNLFKDQGKKRTRTAYYIGKGHDVEAHPKDSILIDSSVTSDQQGLADLLNTCKVMYTYENPTALNEIARLTGCPVVYLSAGAGVFYSKEELDKKYEPSNIGLFYDEEPKEFDPTAFRKHYLSLIDKFEKKLDKFIEETQQ